MLTKAARLQLFLSRLAAANPVATHDEALVLIAASLNAVEDEHSGVPANPANWEFDGRMYPAQVDMARPSPNRHGVIIYRNRRHRTLIATNGAFVITEVSTNAVLVEKAGLDGKTLLLPGISGNRA